MFARIIDGNIPFLKIGNRYPYHETTSFCASSGAIIENAFDM